MEVNGLPVVKLGEILPASYKNGIYKDSGSYGSGTPILRITDFNNDGNLVNGGLRRLELTPKEIKSYQLLRDDIVVNRVNSLTHLGKSILWRSELEKEVVYESNMMRIEPDKSVILPEFLIRVLQSYNARSHFRKVAKRAVAQCSISQQDVKSLRFPLPPICEQKKISQILSTWDQAITATERLLENSRQRKNGLMQQLLTGKKRLPGFEGKWKQEELGKLVTISKGEQLNRSTLSEAGLYPVINGGIMPSGYADKTNCHGNTVTISEGGNSCGFVAFQQVPFWCGGHCYALKSPQVPVMFLYQLLKLYEVKIMRMRVGSGLPNIQKKDLSGLKLVLPTCPDEQEAIGQILAVTDRECQLLVDRLNSLKREKKALMQQLLTGKRRVKVEVNAA